MPLELTELRDGTVSTVFCTQFEKKHWRPKLGDGVHADAIMDRVAHNAVWVDVGEANMRQYREIGYKSNTRAPVQMLTPVPTRNNGGAAS